SGNEFAFQQDSYGNDGCAYDFEFTAENITFRDNFIYDCYGEAILFMPGVNGNVIMRENIVIEDNLFINNCAGSKVHRSEISFILKDGYDGDITIRNNRFMLVPKIRTIFPVPKCIIDENNMEIADAIIETPEYIFDAASKTIAFSCADPDAVLYFTTDGSVPTQKSEKYTGQKIEITKTTVVNCKAYKSGYLPSRACVALVSPN
ncbi:MAG: chitobiase/beta-hexosaminidase C-terminal domain-containing protein, partial [Oscillospiraceae bacterium]|nr:chitobiase/beta-hexosaminidase C-terminal domain-containing protein [Oscillospiraceae bacterium]